MRVIWTLFLIEITKQLSSIQESLLADNRTQIHADEIRKRLIFVDGLVAGVPTAPELRDENYYWTTLNRQYAAYRKSLSSRAIYLEAQIRFLDSQQAEWQATLDKIDQSSSLNGVAERITQELAKFGPRRGLSRIN